MQHAEVDRVWERFEEAEREETRCRKAVEEAQSLLKQATEAKKRAEDALFYATLWDGQCSLARRIDTMSVDNRLREFVGLLQLYLTSFKNAKATDIHADYHPTHAILHARGLCRLRVDIHGRVSHDTRHLPSPPHLNLLEDDVRTWNPLNLH